VTPVHGAAGNPYEGCVDIPEADYMRVHVKLAPVRSVLLVADETGITTK
jgi:hypothetical protein